MNNQNYWGEPARAVAITIRTENGVGDYELPDKTILNNCAAWVGIGMRAPGSNKKTRTGNDLINATAFACGHILLRDDVSDDYLREIPLEYIQLDTSNEQRFYRLPNTTFDIANSKITFSDPTALVTGEEIELVIFYR